MGNNKSSSPGPPAPTSAPKPTSSRNRPVRKWATVDTGMYKFDFSTPPADIDNIKWKDMEGCMKTESDEGAQGVIFVKIKNQGAVVLKSSMELAGEVFSTRIARQLGIPGPKMRIIGRSTPEGQEIYNTVSRLSPTLSRMIQTVHIIVMEYLTGTTLHKVKPGTFNKFVNNKKNESSYSSAVGGLSVPRYSPE